jgi:hypothetical protein
VVSVTLLQEKPRTEITRMPVKSHFTEWVFGVIGVVAAAVGAYMYYAPSDWFLSGLVEHWYFGMFTGAGVLLAMAFGIFARKAFLEDRRYSTRVVTGLVLAVAALAAAVTFAIIWIL